MSDQGSHSFGLSQVAGRTGQPVIELSRVPQIVRSRWLLVSACTSAFVLAAIAAYFVLPQKYTATASVVIDSRGVNHLMGVAAATVAQSTLIATQSSIVSSERVAREVAAQLELARDPTLQAQWQNETEGQGDLGGWIVRRLLNKLSVSRSAPDSTVLNIAFTDPDPVNAARLANAFAETYLSVTLDLSVSPARLSARFFDDRISATRDALRAAQNRLSSYQRQHGIVSGDEKLDVETAQLNDLATALTSSRAKRIDSRSRKQYASGPFESPEILQNPVVQALTTEVARAQAKLKQLSKDLGVNHPQYRAAQEELAEFEKKLMEQSRRVASSLNVTEQVSSQGEKELLSALNAQRQRVLELRNRRDQAAVLERDVDSAQKAYDYALQRFSQTSQESQSGLNDASMLTTASVPFESNRRRLTLTVPFAGICGFMLGLVAALILESRAPRIRNGRDLAEWFDLPILGAVAYTSIRRSRRRSPQSQLPSHGFGTGRIA
jgi:chain length determinant protein EpsF